MKLFEFEFFIYYHNMNIIIGYTLHYITLHIAEAHKPYIQ